MAENRIQSDLRTVVAAQLGLPERGTIPRDDHLGRLGINAGQLCQNLGISTDAVADLTLASLAAAVEADRTEGRLSDLAVRSRVQRLVGAMLASTQVIPTAADFAAWWNELVTQVVWWHCAEAVDGGKTLVQNDIPAEVSALMIKAGVSDPEALVNDPDRNRATMTDLLVRFGIDKENAGAVFQELLGLAQRLRERDEGQLQWLLRRHANQMTHELAADVTEGVPDNSGVLHRAVLGWVSAMTRLPICVWSPSTMHFVKKFRYLGLTEERLEEVAAGAGVDFVGVDEALSQFFEALCLSCDPMSPEDRYCIRKFAEIGWEVECVDPNNASAPQ